MLSYFWANFSMAASNPNRILAPMNTSSRERNVPRTPINAWAIEDRPREKMISKGVATLTESELVATLLSSGTRTLSAIELGRKLIDHFGGLRQLARASIADLMRVHGIGAAKATTISAAFELARRKGALENQPIRFTDPSAIARYLVPKLTDLPYEVFHVIYLDQYNQLISEHEVFKGGVTFTTVDPKVIFKEAVSKLAASIVVCHNHPTGNPEPSKADIELTRRLVAYSFVMDVKLLDHIIVAGRRYYSFADVGGLLQMRRDVREEIGKLDQSQE
jgi:DNA repair protein RadC